MSTALTRTLDELRREDAAEFGGKSANLGDLLAGDIPVPGGFAVSAEAYRAFVAETGIDGAIAAALSRVTAGDVHSITAAAKAIDEAMRFAPLPGALRDELEGRYAALATSARLDVPPVAVRSSALGEDGAEASFAGQQESFLWIRGVDQLCDAVRDCWVSLHTPQAIAYRAELPGEPAMGVTVQLMVDAEVSGVMFTCNPVSGDPSMVAVNASWGLGIAVVSGEVTPDDYLVSKITGEVVRRTVSDKPVEYVPDPEGRGTVRRDVADERREQACLDDDALAELVRIGRRVESHFGARQDIEWAIARGSRAPEGLVVLQSRPVTAAAQTAPATGVSAMSLVLNTFGASRTRDEEP